MKVFSSVQEFNSEQPVILTIGMFDGVHIGHRKIIDYLNELAQEVNGISTLLSFNPHPRFVLQQGTDLRLLNDLEEKKIALEQSGLDAFIVLPFTKEFSRLTAVDFVREYLVQGLNVHTLVVGYNHQFGRNREGNFEQLSELAELYDFQLKQIPEIRTEDEKVSSTSIRNAILGGNLEYAKRALNQHYTIRGKVVHGEKIGRTLGFPTANLEVDNHKLIPKNGVYVVKSNFKDSEYFGVMNIGQRPTVSENQNTRIEVHLFDFNQKIYGENLYVEILSFLRKEQQFSTKEELKQQIELDAINAQKRISYLNQSAK